MKRPPRIKPSELATRLVGGKLSEMANYSDLFKKTRDPIFLLDSESLELLECNPAAAALGEVPLARWRKTLEKSLGCDKPFDLTMEEHTFEATAAMLRLSDYCDVIQLIAKDVSAERQAKADLLAANRRLERLATTDELTKLFNVRYFRSELAREHERCARHKKSYAIILCDIDHFKNFNDQNGHVAGDSALQLAAAVLQGRARDNDILARYGGEEFVVLCPETNAEQAEIFAEALRRKIEETNFPHGDKQPLGRVTLSLGVAAFPANGKTSAEVLHHADEALYACKHAGRNRVIRYQNGLATKLRKKSA